MIPRSPQKRPLRSFASDGSEEDYVWTKGRLSRKSHEAFLADSGEASSGNIDVLTLHDTAAEVQIATSKLEIGIAGRRVRLVVFEAVEILVSLAAHFAAVWLLFLHAEGTGIWC